mmetsp:Transcript_81486/g.141519  ORF Transcript_81486/g.141519 Transcript_81486/m.141519 type:complete len:234 (+) Transcript_81486:389-1090(+)
MIRLSTRLVGSARVAARAEQKLNGPGMPSVRRPPKRSSPIASPSIWIRTFSQENLNNILCSTSRRLAKQGAAIRITCLQNVAFVQEGQDLVNLAIECVLQRSMALFLISLLLLFLQALLLGFALHPTSHALLKEKLLLVELKSQLFLASDFRSSGSSIIRCCTTSSSRAGLCRRTAGPGSLCSGQSLANPLQFSRTDTLQSSFHVLQRCGFQLRIGVSCTESCFQRLPAFAGG